MKESPLSHAKSLVLNKKLLINSLGNDIERAQGKIKEALEDLQDLELAVTALEGVFKE